jgi:hypothetical protein
VPCMAIVHEQARSVGLAGERIGVFEGLDLGWILRDLGDGGVRMEVGNGSRIR